MSIMRSRPRISKSSSWGGTSFIISASGIGINWPITCAKCCSIPASLSRPYLQRKVVEQVVQGHLKGNRNYTTALHKLLSLEHLHRLFIDSSCH